MAMTFPFQGKRVGFDSPWEYFILCVEDAKTFLNDTVVKPKINGAFLAFDLLLEV
jgi:hypothetical protein